MSSNGSSSGSDPFNFANSQNYCDPPAVNDENDPDGHRKGHESSTSIRHFLQRGCSREEVFKILDLKQDSKVAIEQVTACFKHIDEHPHRLYGGKLDNSQFELAIKIANECVKVRNAISIWPTADINSKTFRFLDSRYALTFANHGATKQLYLFDNFHGQKKLIRTERTFPKTNNFKSCFMEVIDAKLLLFIRNYKKRGSFIIFLLAFDSHEAKCKRLDYKEHRGRILDIIFDYSNRHHFAIRSNKKDGQYLRLVHVKNQRLVADLKPILFNNELFCERLNGGRLQTLRFLPNSENSLDVEDRWDFGEFELTAGFNNPPFQPLFEICSDDSTYGIRNHPFRWHGDNCFIFNKNCTHNRSELIVLDLKTRQLNFNKFNIQFNGNGTTIFTDNDNYLTVCAEDPTEKAFFIYRFPQRQPDSLTNLILLKLRRDVMFSGKVMDKKIFQHLPFNLRPMALCPSKKVDDNDKPTTSKRNSTNSVPSDKKAPEKRRRTN